MTEKPLHVQVAEALGCKPVNVALKGDPILHCRCAPIPPHASGGDGIDYLDVARYDSDWSATGPLIEKYRIHVTPCNHNDEPWHWVALSDYDEFNADPEAATPLLAVCNLILALHKAGKLPA